MTAVVKRLTVLQYAPFFRCVAIRLHDALKRHVAGFRFEEPQPYRTASGKEIPTKLGGVRFCGNWMALAAKYGHVLCLYVVHTTSLSATSF